MYLLEINAVNSFVYRSVRVYFRILNFCALARARGCDRVSDLLTRMTIVYLPPPKFETTISLFHVNDFMLMSASSSGSSFM